MKKSLLEIAVSHLNQTKGTWPAVAKASGVPLRTLEKIARRETKNPGVAHVEKILRHFQTNKKA